MKLKWKLYPCIHYRSKINHFWHWN